MKLATLTSGALLVAAVLVAAAQEDPPSRTRKGAAPAAPSSKSPTSAQQQKPAAPKDSPKPAPNAPPAPTAKIHFEPAKLDHTDLAVGETVVDHVTLVADGPTNWDLLQIADGCDCIHGEFVGDPTPLRATVKVNSIGLHEEERDTHIVLQTVDRKVDFAQLDVHLKVARVPFVSPRELNLDPKSPDRFELTIGQAFDKTTEKTPEAGMLLVDLDTSKLDQKKIDLLDTGPDETDTRPEKYVIVRIKLSFFVQKDAQAKPFDTEIPVEFGAPPVKKNVKVHWPATKK